MSLRRPFSFDSDDSAEFDRRKRLRPLHDAEDVVDRAVGASDPADVSEDDDPLDAFMAGIHAQASRDLRRSSAAASGTIDTAAESSSRLDLEEEAVELDLANAVAQRRRARTADPSDAVEQEGVQDADNDDPQRGKQDVEPLKAVDHTAIDYPEIRRRPYADHPEVAAMAQQQVEQYRRDHGISVSSYSTPIASIPRPAVAFAHMGLDDSLIEAIRRAGYVSPTPIQQQEIPVGLAGHDVVGVASTGSGKTLAYLIPTLVHAAVQWQHRKRVLSDAEMDGPTGMLRGPIGVVLVPTRELATQIYGEAKKFAKAFALRVAVVYGGVEKVDQLRVLRSIDPTPVHLLIATPGRLIDMVRMKATHLRGVSALVLDEADRMFDLGFEPQVRSLCLAIRPDRQTMLFSATLSKRIEKLAASTLRQHVRITVGAAALSGSGGRRSEYGQVGADIQQCVQVLNDDGYKWPWLVAHLPAFLAGGSVILFVNRKEGAAQLAEGLRSQHLACGALHGDMLQQDRQRVMQGFKDGRFRVLVATDLAARGLDIPSVRTVVSYDAPTNRDSHVHRAGRTGRAGERGVCWTLVTQKEEKAAAELMRALTEAGAPVPPDLQTLARRGGGASRGRRLPALGQGEMRFLPAGAQSSSPRAPR